MSRILIHKMQTSLLVTDSKIAWKSDQIKTQFLVLQNYLINVPCQGPVVKQICSQLIKEQVFDPLALKNFRGSPDDIYDLVMMFMNREPEDVYKFLEILMNINKFPILSGNFRQVIKKLIVVPKEKNQPLKTLNSNQFNHGDELMILKRSVSSSSILPAEEVQLNERKKFTNFKRKAENTISCPDLMTFGFIVDDFKENKKTKLVPGPESTSNGMKDHVSLDMSTISENTASSTTSEKLATDEIDPEKKPLVKHVSSRPKIKARRISRKLKFMGAVLGLGMLGSTMALYPRSTALTENSSGNNTSNINNAWVNNALPDNVLENLNVVERQVNNSFYKYNFA